MLFYYLLAGMVALYSGCLFTKVGRTSPLVLFLTPWLPIAIVVEASSPAPAIWEVLGAALLGVCAGVTSAWLYDQGKAETVELRQSYQLDRTNLLLRLHVTLCFVLILYAFLQIYSSYSAVQSYGGFSAIFSPEGADFRRQQLENGQTTASQALDSSSASLGLLNYLFFIGHASLFTGSLLWTRGRRLLAVQPVVLCLIYSLLSLQRTSFFMAVLLFVFSIVGWRQGVERPRRTTAVTERLRGVVFSFLALAVVLAGLIIPLEFRNANSKNGTGLDSLAQYVFSGTLGLNARSLPTGGFSVPPSSDSAGPGSFPGFGAYTFSNVYSNLARLGVRVPDAPKFLDYYEVSLNNERFVSNTGTMLYTFYLDGGGLAGDFIGLFILAVTTMLVKSRLDRGNAGLVPLWAFLATTLAWSFYGSTLLSDVRYLICVLISVPVFNRLLLRSQEPRSDGVEMVTN